MNAVLRWWKLADHFDWLTLYLNTRGIRLIWRAAIAAVIATMAVLPAMTFIAPTRTHNSAAAMVAMAASGFGMTVALLWLIRWPTRGQSLLCALTGSGFIAAACLTQSDPLAGMLGSGAFAVLGGYIAFFHTPPYLMANSAVALSTAMLLAERMVQQYGITLASCAVLLAVIPNVAFPSAVQWLVHSLAGEMQHSSRDPLTGLLIRRAFYQSTYELLLRRRQGPSYLGAAMIDLDNFKRLNDTHGHSAGDKALVAVAGALRLACPPTTMIARFGGEEFVVADVYRTDDLHDVAEHLRKAIAAACHPVTASIGIAGTPLAANFAAEERELIDRVIEVADTAMYAAKRAGGNQSRSTYLPPVDHLGRVVA